MGLFDKAKDKAAEAAEEHPEQVDAATEKAGEFVDEKTGGKFSDQIDSGVEKAQEGLGNLGGGEEEGEEGA